MMACAAIGWTHRWRHEGGRTKQTLVSCLTISDKQSSFGLQRTTNSRRLLAGFPLDLRIFLAWMKTKTFHFTKNNFWTFSSLGDVEENQWDPNCAKDHNKLQSPETHNMEKTRKNSYSCKHTKRKKWSKQEMKHAANHLQPALSIIQTWQVVNDVGGEGLFQGHWLWTPLLSHHTSSSTTMHPHCLHGDRRVVNQPSRGDCELEGLKLFWVLELQCFSSWESAVLENAVAISVARCHGEGRVTLIGGIGRQVLTQRHRLLQLGGDCWRCRVCQSVTWGVGGRNSWPLTFEVFTLKSVVACVSVASSVFVWLHLCCLQPISMSVLVTWLLPGKCQPCSVRLSHQFKVNLAGGSGSRGTRAEKKICLNIQYLTKVSKPLTF